VIRSAVVVGAGVAGLATAGALARTGWSVTLLERSDRLRPGRAAMLLWPNGVRALRALGLGAGLDAIATPVPPAGLRRPDGQWLVQPDRAADRAADGTGSPPEPPVVVHRADLHDAFVAGLGDKIDIRTGIEVRTVRPTGDRAAVGDGRAVWEADLVVAADGLDSVVRRRFAPAVTAASGGFAAWRAVIPWYRAPHLASGVPVVGEVLGAGQRFQHASLGQRGSAGGSSRGGMYWVATVPGAHRPEPPEAQLVLLRRWFAGWPAPITELLAATEPDDLVQDPIVELRPMPDSFVFPYGTGGYALVGDAAHAMTHHLGQGGCLALEDAATLQALVLDAIPGRNLWARMQSYSEDRRPRVVRVAQQSRRVGAVLQERGRLLTRARDMALGTLAPRLLDKAAAGATDWRPPAR
jgi:2-polyprenyl-6-methoxyphenol hydroxylase-like FAD-dependent oxidoreductase